MATTKMNSGGNDAVCTAWWSTVRVVEVRVDEPVTAHEEVGAVVVGVRVAPGRPVGAAGAEEGSQPDGQADSRPEPQPRPPARRRSPLVTHGRSAYVSGPEGARFHQWDEDPGQALSVGGCRAPLGGVRPDVQLSSAVTTTELAPKRRPRRRPRRAASSHLRRALPRQPRRHAPPRSTWRDSTASGPSRWSLSSDSTPACPGSVAGSSASTSSSCCPAT